MGGTNDGCGRWYYLAAEMLLLEVVQYEDSFLHCRPPAGQVRAVDKSSLEVVAWLAFCVVPSP